MTYVSSDQNVEIGSAGGGTENCTAQPDGKRPEGVFNSGFQNSTFTHNLIVGGANWPAGNLMVNDFVAAGVWIKHESGANRVCRQKDGEFKKPSVAIVAGTDGKNVGC